MRLQSDPLLTVLFIEIQIPSSYINSTAHILAECLHIFLYVHGVVV